MPLLAPPARPLYLDVAGGQAFAFFHPVPEDAPERPAVLLCPPVGWPEVCSYRIRRQWAEDLAAAGHAVLRLDLPGTGDSTGAPDDAGRVEAWVQGVIGAAHWLRQAARGSRVVAVGLGSGGALAWLALARGAPVEDLVLWATPARGHGLVRELRALGRLESAIAPPPDAALDPPAGSLSVAGFLFTAETLADLERIELADVPLGGWPGRRALLLGRDARAPDSALAERLRADGVEVSAAPGPGWSAMALADEPQEAVAPVEAFARIGAWLEEAAGPDAHEVGPPVPTREVLELDGAGPPVRESPWSAGRLFGVLSDPVGERHDVVAVLLNAGAVRRTGPNRLWVQLARAWAARGVRTLRLDVEGIGDAGGDGSRFADVIEMYDDEVVEQVVAALDALRERDPDARFVLVGLCAGAYWAVRAAVEDDRVIAAFAVNAWSLSFDPSLRAVRDLQRVLRDVLRPTAWPTVARKLRKGQISGVRVRRLARHVLRREADPAADDVAHGSGHAVEPVLDHLRAAGKRTLLVFSEGEPLLGELTATGLIGQRDRWPGLRVPTLPGRSHTFAPVQSQRRLTTVLDAALADVMAGVDETVWPLPPPVAASAVGPVDSPEGRWLGDSDRPLMGWLSLPEGGASTSGALLLPAAAYGYWTTHRTMRTIAERLAAQGHVALRIDFEGTGDSSGSQWAPDRLAAWRDSVRAGYRELQELGCTEIVVLGARLGATLALLTAGELGAAAVAAWAPVAGRRHARELRMVSTPVPEAAHPADPPGTLVMAGTVLRADTLSDLATLDPAKLDRAPAPRVLIAGAPDSPFEASLAERLGGLGADVELVTPADTELALEQPTEYATVPGELVDAIGRWAGTAPAGRTPRPAPRRTVTLTWDGARVTEEVVALGPARLAGIETRPAHAGDSAVTLVLLSSGSEPHIGPGRAWVEYARALAGRGHRVVRADFRGWGESPDDGRAPGRPYDRHCVADAVAIARAVRARHGGAVVLGGLCASAWVALEAVLQEPIDGVVALNPQLYWRPGHPVEATMAETHARRAPDRRREARGQRLRLWSALDVLGVRTREGRWLDRLRRRGAPILMLFAEGDDGLDFLRTRLGRRLRRAERANVEVVELPDIDHSQHRAWLRGTVVDELARYLDEVARAT